MNELSIRQTGSLPTRSSTSNLSTEDIKDLHEVLSILRSELSDSVNILYQKLDEEMSNASLNNKPETLPFSESVGPLKLDLSKLPNAEKGSPGTECEIGEYSVIEQGIEEFLQERCAGADNISLIAQLLHRSKAHLQSTLLQNNGAIIEDFYVHMVDAVPELTEHIHRTTARLLLHINAFKIYYRT